MDDFVHESTGSRPNIHDESVMGGRVVAKPAGWGVVEQKLRMIGVAEAVFEEPNINDLLGVALKVILLESAYRPSHGVGRSALHDLWRFISKHNKWLLSDNCEALRGSLCYLLQMLRQGGVRPRPCAGFDRSVRRATDQKASAAGN